MVNLRIGDVVKRRTDDSSADCNILFKVSEINKIGDINVVTVRGICFRIEMDIPETELELQPEKKVKEYGDNFWRIADNNTKNANVHSKSLLKG